MSKEKKILLTPKLRFPEYQNRPAWLETELGQLSDRLTRKVGDLNLTTVSISAGKGFVSQLAKFGKNISGDQYNNYIILSEGEFAYNKGNSIRYPQGSIYKLKEFKKVAAPNSFICFKFKDKFIADFYQSYFDKNYHGYQLKKFITSGARSDGLLNINADDFFNITLPTPIDNGEQQKIADCLATIQELIDLHTLKLDNLKILKKGLMQKLFPAVEKLTPKLRFPEFANDPEWEIVPFKQIFTRIKTKNKENNQNVLTISAQKGLISQLDYFNKSIAAKDLSGYYLLHKGDFAYNKSYSKGYPMGAIKPLKFYEKGVVSTLYIGFKANDGVNGDFFEYYFDAGQLNTEIQKIAQEGARNHGLLNIGIDDFFDKIEVIIPVSKTEQCKIASCLSDLDKLIVAQTDKVEALTIHKKGLLQQLVPAIN